MRGSDRATVALLAIGVAGITGAGCGAGDGAELTGSSAADLGSANLVISQVYGGGGNSGATYKNDFIEIFNRGASSVSVVNWSIPVCFVHRLVGA